VHSHTMTTPVTLRLFTLWDSLAGELLINAVIWWCLRVIEK
jgi:hypothetical protein